MSIVQTTIYGDGNFFYNTTSQNGVYQNHAFTSQLKWNLDYTAPTPTGEAINLPTQSVDLPHTLFVGFSDGYWVHRLFLNGHLVKTFTFSDQQFSIPIQYDSVQSVALVSSPTQGQGIECDHRHDGDCPAPSGAAALIICALMSRTRKRN